MLAVGQDDERIHFEAQIDLRSGGRSAAEVGEFASLVGDNLGKEVQVRDEITFAESMLPELD